MVFEIWVCGFLQLQRTLGRIWDRRRLHLARVLRQFGAGCHGLLLLSCLTRSEGNTSSRSTWTGINNESHDSISGSPLRLEMGRESFFWGVGHMQAMILIVIQYLIVNGASTSVFCFVLCYLVRMAYLTVLGDHAVTWIKYRFPTCRFSNGSAHTLGLWNDFSSSWTLF